MKRNILLYVILLFSLFGSSAQTTALRKMSPSVRQMFFERQLGSARHSAAAASRQELCAFAKTSSAESAFFSMYGVRLLASFGDVHIVSIPMERLSAFASDFRVTRIEAGRGMATLNDKMAQHLNIAKVYEGTALPQAYTGKGVVMGIQDVGFDLTNPNFYSADMSEYRIKAMWDMLSADTIGSPFYVGNDYVGRDALLAYAHSRDGMQQAHGSHTLGTAAGSGFGSPYRGIAFESDICLVSNAVGSDENLIDEADQGKYTYATDALGFKYIFDYAESVGKPCVISFSEGSVQDLYGDDILYNEILERLTGPGRIIVSSAGNGSHSPNWFRKPAGQTSAGTFLESWTGSLYFMSTGKPEYQTRLVFYGEKNDTLAISADWLCQQQDSLHYDTLQVNNHSVVVAEGAYPDCYNPERLVLEIYIKGPAHMGGVAMPISLETVGADSDVETYNISGYFTTKTLNPALADAVVAKNINSPSSCPAVICVGSTSYSTGFVNIYGDEMDYDSGHDGERSSFSSVGPTLDGRMKPDVMAPGANIVSSTNSFYFEANPTDRQFTDFVGTYQHGGRTYYWKADTGTSMSSPAIGGAIALWLEAKPDLTREEILDVFAHTCSHPDPALDYPNNEYGYGQIDVYRGLLYLLGLSGIDGISLHQPERVAFSITAPGAFSVNFPEPLAAEARVSVFSTSGQLLLRQTVARGEDSCRVALPATVKGIVAVQVDGGSPETTGSTLLRF